MSEAFLALSADERREALAVAASASGRPAHLLEKDIWVVWALDALFSSPLGEHLVFKGGTSLSKAYGVIRRFSEDVDLTYDIRALAPDLVGQTGDALPATRSEERRWTKAVGQRLPHWVEDHVLPTLQARLTVDGAPARLRLDGEKVFVEYEPLAMSRRRSCWSLAPGPRVNPARCTTSSVTPPDLSKAWSFRPRSRW